MSSKRAAMNGRDMVLVLAHLFRMKGSPLRLDEAVRTLSFRWRYGSPSNVRRMLRAAVENKMISVEGDSIEACFLFDKQRLPPNQAAALEDSIHLEGKYNTLD